MLILGKDTMKDPSLGYARTFVRQLEDCLGLALEQGVKIVSNAGGLNPAGLADRLREVAKGLGLDPRGRPRRGRRPPRRLGLCDGRADRQRLPRRLRHRGRARPPAPTSWSPAGSPTRALVVGPAVAHHGWTPTSYDELAGAVVAGHVHRVRRPGDRRQLLRLPSPGPRRHGPRQPLGFPIAEIAADGSSVITKHDGTGGAVTVDTVTAQLVYEIQSTRYLNPDVTTLPRHRSGSRRTGPDRVAITGVRGEAAAGAAQGLRQRARRLPQPVEFVLTGLDIEAKADWVREQLTPALTAQRRSPGPGPPLPPADADTEEGASCLLRCTVQGPAARPGRPRVHRPGGRARARVVPRLHDDRPAAAADAVRRLPAGVRRPRGRCTHTVVHADGRREEVADPTEFADGRPRRRAGARRRTPRPPTRSTAGCRSAPSCTRAPATRAATPTSGSGWSTTATRRRTTPGSPGWPS